MDAALLEWAECHVSGADTVWDIGANSGIFTMAAAGRGARVLAVEPDPFLANALMRTRSANPQLHIEVLAGAISDKRGTATLEISSGGRAANALSTYALGRTAFGHSLAQVLVPTLRLDDLLSVSTPSLLKIDVEGAELAVFQGASRLLRQVRPRIIVEVGRELWPQVSALLREARYRLVHPLETTREADEATYNVLALPQ
jgi:FkbM family methyltransferase